MEPGLGVVTDLLATSRHRADDWIRTSIFLITKEVHLPLCYISIGVQFRMAYTVATIVSSHRRKTAWRH